MSARILVIEDNPANMDLMVYLLRTFGHMPLLAFDGESGVEMALREIPDLILCDVNLPVMDGFAVVRNVRSSQPLRHVPIVAVTALAMVGDREKLLDAGFDGYIAKPIEPEAFMSSIEKFLRVDLRTVHMLDMSSCLVKDAPADIEGHASVLVVDDSPINRELARSTLEPFGYRVVLASNVRQGWERAQNESIDLVLCDLHMPDQDGFELIKKIKGDQRFAGIPVLFISASFNNDEDFDKAYALGVTRFLRRPIEPQALVDEIAMCLHQPNHCSNRSADGHHPDR